MAPLYTFLFLTSIALSGTLKQSWTHEHTLRVEGEIKDMAWGRIRGYEARLIVATAYPAKVYAWDGASGVSLGAGIFIPAGDGFIAHCVDWDPFDPNRFVTTISPVYEAPAGASIFDIHQAIPKVTLSTSSVPEHSLYSAMYSHEKLNGKTVIATVGFPTIAKLFSSDGTVVTDFTGHTSPEINTCRFAVNDNRLQVTTASCTEECTWDAQTGATLSTVTTAQTKTPETAGMRITSRARALFAKKGSTYFLTIVGFEDGTFGFAKEGEELTHIKAHDMEIVWMDAFGAGKTGWLATASYDGSVKIWTIGDEAPLLDTVININGPITRVKFQEAAGRYKKPLLAIAQTNEKIYIYKKK